MSAYVQVFRTELDWLVGMSHGRLPLLIRSVSLERVSRSAFAYAQ